MSKFLLDDDDDDDDDDATDDDDRAMTIPRRFLRKPAELKVTSYSNMTLTFFPLSVQKAAPYENL